MPQKLSENCKIQFKNLVKNAHFEVKPGFLRSTRFILKKPDHCSKKTGKSRSASRISIFRFFFSMIGFFLDKPRLRTQKP